MNLDYTDQTDCYRFENLSSIVEYLKFCNITSLIPTHTITCPENHTYFFAHDLFDHLVIDAAFKYILGPDFCNMSFAVAFNTGLSETITRCINITGNSNSPKMSFAIELERFLNGSLNEILRKDYIAKQLMNPQLLEIHSRYGYEIDNIIYILKENVEKFCEKIQEIYENLYCYFLSADLQFPRKLHLDSEIEDARKLMLMRKKIRYINPCSKDFTTLKKLPATDVLKMIYDENNINIGVPLYMF